MRGAGRTGDGSVDFGGAEQAAEKPVGTVILRSPRRRGIPHSLENTQNEILRFAQDDSISEFFRRL
jgi:hypothetical protein